MRKKKIAKGITAVVMCAVLLVTSLPFALAWGGGPYDPAPYFDGEAEAWFNDDGGITVAFPEASGRQSYTDWENNYNNYKTIEYYYLELVDLGSYGAVHTSTVVYDNLYAASETQAYGDLLTVTLTAEKLEELGLSSSSRLSAEIYAVDSENWISAELSALVSDVPEFEYKGGGTPLVDDEHAMREILTFEAQSSTDVHSLGTDAGTQYFEESETNYTLLDNAGYTKYVQTNFEQRLNGSLSVKGAVEQSGVEDANGTDSWGMRLYLDDTATSTGGSVDLSYSRQTYDLSGAEEIFYYIDAAQTTLYGVSFRLRSNEKYIVDYYNYRYIWPIDWSTRTAYANKNYGRNIDWYYEFPDVSSNFSWASQVNTTMFSETVYSTRGYSGSEAAYVYLQKNDGSWEKTYLSENGTVDLENYTGYIRVPIKFICSETDSSVTATNTNIGSSDYKYKSVDEAVSSAGFMLNTSGVSAVAVNGSSSYYLAQGTTAYTVDPAGTCITDALLLQHRVYNYNNDTKYVQLGSMLAAGQSDSDILQSYSNSKRATYTVDENSKSVTVTNRDAAYKAIEDLAAAGIAYESASEGNVSVYLDNVMGYRTDNNPYNATELKLNGETVTSTGQPVSTYYNQNNVVVGAILDYVDLYISDPDYSDYRAVSLIENMISGYVKDYAAAGHSTDFLDNLSEDKWTDTDMTSTLEGGSIASAAATLGRSEAWSNFVEARAACVERGTYGKVNSLTTDLVPDFAKQLEKMPDIAEASEVSLTEEQQDQLLLLYQAYRRLNLMQLEALGEVEEQKLIDLFLLYYDLVADGTVLVGASLADYPYMLFNDFESNNDAAVYNADGRVWQLENDPDTTGITSSSYRQTKGLWSYSVSELHGDKGITTYDALGIDDTIDFATRANASWAKITSAGYNNSTGVSFNFNSSFTSGITSTLKYYMTDTGYSVGFTRNSLGGNSLTCSDMNLSDFFDSDNSGDNFLQNDEVPLSLVFYVDFSSLDYDTYVDNPFYFTASIHTTDDEGTVTTFRVDSGNYGTGSSSAWHKFYYIDANGEWSPAYSTSTTPISYGFSSTSYRDTEDGGTEAFSFAGYTGYIAIPIRQFKTDTNDVTYLDGGYTSLGGSKDESRLKACLNNIFAIELIFGGGNVGFDNKEITIDNVGFTYDPQAYADEGYSLSRNDQDYASQFGSTSTAAYAFMNAVSDIDIYADTFTADLAAAQSMYSDLSDYQKSLKGVIDAWALCEKYQGYVDAPSTKPTAQATVMDIQTLVNTLISNEKTVTDGIYLTEDGNTAGDYDLPFPGFTGSMDDSSVNYALYGMDAALAEAINAAGITLLDSNGNKYDEIDTTTDVTAGAAITDLIIQYYETGYERMSPTELASFTAEQVTALENAYSAAVRCADTMETYQTELQEYYASLLAGEHVVPVSVTNDDTIGTDNSGFDDDYDDANPTDPSQTTLYFFTLCQLDENGKLVLDENGHATRDENMETAVNNMFVKFFNLEYYAKQILNQSDRVSSRAAQSGTNLYLWTNQYKTIELADGSVLSTGIETLLNKYLDLYKEVKGRIDDTADNPDKEDMDNVLNAINEYCALAMPYQYTAGLLEAVRLLRSLFPLCDLSSETDTVNLSNKISSGETSYEINYLIDVSREEKTTSDIDYNYYYYSYVTGGKVYFESENGGFVLADGTPATDAYGNQLTYNLVSDSGVSFNSAQIYDGDFGNLITDKNDSLLDMATSFEKTITVSLDDAQSYNIGADLHDTVKLTFYEAVQVPVYVQETDENGNPVTDDDGNPVYVQEAVMVQQTDGDGNPVTDDDGNPVMVQQTDENGDPVYVYVQALDTDGSPLYTEGYTPLTDSNGDVISYTIDVLYTMTDSYTVTIPADIEIGWGDTQAHSAAYSVEAVLNPGASLGVTVADKYNSSALTLSGVADTLPYSLVPDPITLNATSDNFMWSKADNSEVTSSTSVQVTSPEAWNIAVGGYKTDLTYTVAYTPAGSGG